MLVGLQAPGNYGPEYKRDFDAMYPELAVEYGALHVESFLGPLGERIEADGAAELMQADGLHPSKAGVALIVEGLGPSVLELIRRIE